MRDTKPIVERHQSFWERGPAERPLGACWIGSRYPGELYPAAAALPKGRVEAGDVNVPAFLADYRRLHEIHESIDDDSFWVASPFFGMPWVEATLGCPVYYAGESGWVDPVIADLGNPPTLPLAAGEPWRQKLREFVRGLVELADGQYPIAPTLMRGPSDLVAAVRGHVEMVYDLYDHPAEVESLIAGLTGHWLSIARDQLELIPPFAGGYSTHFYRVWAPRNVVCFQEDTSASFSPETYTRFLRPADQRIAESFPYSVIHIHSTATWPVEYLLGLPALSCVEINCDNNGPRLPDLLPLLRQIQQVKPLVIRGEFTHADIAFAKQNLSPRGLLLNIVATSVSEAKSLVATLREA